MSSFARIEELHEGAARSARDISHRIDAGAAPSSLIPDLRRQLDAVTLLRDGVRALVLDGHRPDGARLDSLRRAAEALAALADANHVKATRKGLRLTPRRRTR